MRLVFTKKNTGFKDNVVIKQMNDELNVILQKLQNNGGFYTRSNILINAQREYAMYEILLKYKNDYYNNLNVLYVGDEPPDFLGEDEYIQKMNNSLTKKCKMLFDKYDKLMEQARPYFEEYTKITKNLRGAKIK